MQYGSGQARMGEHMRKLFGILIPHAEGLPREAAMARLVAASTLAAHETGVYASTGGKRFDARVSFVTSTLVKAGWMTKEHRLWRVTPAGVEAWREFPDARLFIRTATRVGNARRARRDRPPAAPAVNGTITAESNEPAEREGEPALTLDGARRRSWGAIQAFVTGMSAYEFQYLVADLLRALGWCVSWVAGPGKDGGVDILAFRDPLGASARRLKVQVKQGERLIDIAVLRSFVALLHEDDIGLFVSASGFTRDAEEFARGQGRRVTLIGLERLVELWGENYATLNDAARRRLPLQPVWWLAAAREDCIDG